jgi:nucleoside-diphosphate-sugar epimerase
MPAKTTCLTHRMIAAIRYVMSNHLLIFGMGYTSSHLAAHLRGNGWRVTGTRRAADGDSIAFDDKAAVWAALSDATHILSSVPPSRDGDDPVLALYGDAIQESGASWTGYLSSTGVYGDAGGAWVDESAPVLGRRAGRNVADLAWQDLRSDMRVFRLPGIYGPGRSALDRVSEGKAHRIDLLDQIFSRVHVDDIISGIIASFAGPPGVYNLADDYPCSQNQVIEAACDLLGAPYPPMQSLDEAQLSPMALAFYAENRRVSNGKAKRLLGWTPQYATYRAGLAACMATNIPAITSAAPAPASSDHS